MNNKQLSIILLPHHILILRTTIDHFRGISTIFIYQKLILSSDRNYQKYQRLENNHYLNSRKIDN